MNRPAGQSAVWLFRDELGASRPPLEASKVHGLAVSPGMAGWHCVRLWGSGANRRQLRAASGRAWSSC
jgi:hypothetical protein